MTNRIREILRNSKLRKCVLWMLCGATSVSTYGYVVVPNIPIDECKHRLQQSYDKDALFVLACMADDKLSMYYYICCETNFPEAQTAVYTKHTISGIYHNRFSEMDSLTLNVLRTVLGYGYSCVSVDNMDMLAHISILNYQDTLKATYYYEQIAKYHHPEYTEKECQESVQTRLKYTSDSKSRIIQPTNTAQPGSPEDWRYRIFWDGDISAYNQLIDWARQSSNVFDFYECLYYSLVMAGKYAYEPAKEDLREILSTMITDATPQDALVYRLLGVLM